MAPSASPLTVMFGANATARVFVNAAKAGVACIVQPGGSKKDDEVIAKADELGIAMVFTGTRHFRH